MRKTAAVRSVMESCNNDPRRFARVTAHMMGLCDRNGNPYYDRAGNRRLQDPKSETGTLLERWHPGEISFKAVGVGMLGEDVFESFFAPDSQRLAGYRPLLEAGEGAVGPSAFANINAFTGVVAGLMEVSILEGWENPQFIADKLMPSESTRMFEGRKKIGATRVGNVAEERMPGMPTKRVQFGERWITQPRTHENSLACEVLQETIYLDQTGEASKEANDLGTWLGYNKEIRCIDAHIGVTNTYNYKGTAYNTYISSGYFDNTFANELLHESDYEEVQIKFRNMHDPETDTPVLIMPNKALVNRGKIRTARQIMGDLALESGYRDIPGSTSDPQKIRTGKPAYVGDLEIMESPLVYERCVASDGLALSAANAEKYWWVWEAGKFAVYAQNWPLRTQQAAPNQADMIDRGVVLFVKADERGVPFILEPRRAVRCTN